ncbi:hypothetical protein [Antrihabitans sp. YC2-6]|uniref:hypothetical protein n=1 Tax=Antrihabitans sp. YC2-6 TaxID=2799498 RepID=UPI0018F62D4A|nr:hypothetical protein [Antrihabitans sp. YC2-6]MBJ8347221.1 hypothetical protein [Antrihabitans sp. YC2-6]
MNQVKFLTACRPMPHVSRFEMHRYWDEHHLPLSLRVRRALDLLHKEHAYTVEDYLLHDELWGDGAEDPVGYDQVGVHWLNADTAPATLTSPPAQQAMRKLGVDEKHMTDLTRSPSWFATEHVVYERGPGRTVALPGGPYLKFYSGWYARTDVGRDGAHAAYRGEHGSLITSLATDLGLARYVQNVNIYDPTIEHLSKTVRGTVADAFDGLDEFVWLRDDLIRALDTPEGKQAAKAIRESQNTFADRATSPSWFSVERILY